jgi:chromate transporter
LIVLAFACGYVRYGSTPQAEALLYGIAPVVVAIIVHALWGFLRGAVKGPFLTVGGVTALVLYFLGVVEIPLIFGGALLVLLVRIAQRRRSGEEAAASVPFGLPLGLLAAPRGSRGDGRCGRHLPLVSEDRFGALRASAAFVLSPVVS